MKGRLLWSAGSVSTPFSLLGAMRRESVLNIRGPVQVYPIPIQVNLGLTCLTLRRHHPRITREDAHRDEGHKTAFLLLLLSIPHLSPSPRCLLPVGETGLAVCKELWPVL